MFELVSYESQIKKSSAFHGINKIACAPKHPKFLVCSRNNPRNNPAWFSGGIRDSLPKGRRFNSHSEKFSLIIEVNVPI